MTNPPARRLLPTLLLLPVLLTAVLLTTPPARADGRVVREFGAADFDPALTINKVGDTASVEAVEPPADGKPRALTVLSLDNPGVTQTRYFVLGDVAYSGVEGTAYLELWSDFAGGGHYFSRTMGDAGPMQTISGTSAARPFMLPFTAEPGQSPTKLTLNVVLPGRGKVTLSRVRLVENGPAATPTAGTAAPASPADPPSSADAVLHASMVQQLGDLARRQNDLELKADVQARQLGPNQRTTLQTYQELDAVKAKIADLRRQLADAAPPAAPSRAALPDDLPTLLRERDRLAPMLPTMRATGANTAAIDLEQRRLQQLNDRVLALGGPGMSGSWLNATSIRQGAVATVVDPANPSDLPLRDLSPAAFADLRPGLEQKEADAAADARRAADDLAAAAKQFGDAHPTTLDRQRLFEAAQQRVNTLVDLLAVSNGMARSRLGAFGGLLAWASDHFSAVFLTLIAVSFAMAFVLARLQKAGRGRRLAQCVFGLILAGGLIELFAAGVAVGLGCPTDAWVGLLGGAAMMTVMPLLMLRQVSQKYDDLELRKLRALDMA